MTVDVEDYYQVSAFSDAIERSSWPSLESRVERNTEKLLQLFTATDVKATFFVLGLVAESYPQLIKRIQAAGHEIACHGYSHQLVYKQSPEEFRQETYRSKSFLEDLCGVSVDGYRAASYSITKDSMWALEILADLGFKYDSSIFPISHDRYGVKDAPRNIYWHTLESGKQLLEFPLSTWAVSGYNLPIAGGGIFACSPIYLPA